jgi:hypothetical protein
VLEAGSPAPAASGQDFAIRDRSANAIPEANRYLFKGYGHHPMIAACDNG